MSINQEEKRGMSVKNRFWEGLLVEGECKGGVRQTPPKPGLLVTASDTIYMYMVSGGWGYA